VNVLQSLIEILLIFSSESCPIFALQFENSNKFGNELFSQGTSLRGPSPILMKFIYMNVLLECLKFAHEFSAIAHK
jgi:hypothetical protein